MPFSCFHSFFPPESGIFPGFFLPCYLVYWKSFLLRVSNFFPLFPPDIGGLFNVSILTYLGSPSILGELFLLGRPFCPNSSLFHPFFFSLLTSFPPCSSRRDFLDPSYYSRKRSDLRVFPVLGIPSPPRLHRGANSSFSSFIHSMLLSFSQLPIKSFLFLFFRPLGKTCQRASDSGLAPRDFDAFLRAKPSPLRLIFGATFFPPFFHRRR